MGRTACTEPQCLYKCAPYFNRHIKYNAPVFIFSTSCVHIGHRHYKLLMSSVHENITFPVRFDFFSYCSMYELEVPAMRDFLNSLCPSQFMVFNTLRTGLLDCLNARSRGLTFRHRASCI